jgi:hypothetical protein
MKPFLLVVVLWLAVAWQSAQTVQGAYLPASVCYGDPNPGFTPDHALPWACTGYTDHGKLCTTDCVHLTLALSQLSAAWANGAPCKMHAFRPAIAWEALQACSLQIPIQGLAPPPDMDNYARRTAAPHIAASLQLNATWASGRSPKGRVSYHLQPGVPLQPASEQIMEMATGSACLAWIPMAPRVTAAGAAPAALKGT